MGTGDESVRNRFVTTFDGKSSAFATIFHSTLFRRRLGSDAHKTTETRKIASQKLVSFRIARHTFRIHFSDVFPLFSAFVQMLGKIADDKNED